MNRTPSVYRRNQRLGACCALLIGVTLLCAGRYERSRREADALRAELEAARESGAALLRREREAGAAQPEDAPDPAAEAPLLSLLPGQMTVGYRNDDMTLVILSVEAPSRTQVGYSRTPPELAETEEPAESEEPYVLIATIPFGTGLEPALDALKQADIPHEGDGTGDDAYAVRVPPADAEAARQVLKRAAAEHKWAINFWEEGEKD